MSYDPDTIFKALRLVPDFDGNPNVLTRFISICDQLAAKYLSTAAGSEFSNCCVLNGILNKITGTAACTINSNGIPDSWLGIRAALINNFSDQRDETTLYNDLSLSTQGNKSPQEFYDHCQTLFSTLMTYVTLHEAIPTTIEAKRDLYKKVTMQAFVRGLREPLGSRIRCMRPSTIEKALEYVQEELNIIYLQQRNEPHKVQSTPKIPSLPPNAFIPPRPQHLQVPASKWPTPIGNHYRPPPQPFRLNEAIHNHRGPTHTQRVFGAPPPNYNPRSNVFRLPPRNNQSQDPQPMSGIQRYTPKLLPHTSMSGHDWSKSGNPPPTNYFKTREMNINQCAAYDDSYYNDSYDYIVQEPDYNYNGYDYPYYNTTDFTPDSPYNYHHGSHSMIGDSVTPLETSINDRDFHEDQISEKPK